MKDIVDILRQLDEQLLLAINSMHTPFGDSFMSDFSGRIIWLGLYVAIFYALVRRFGWIRALVWGAGAGLVILFADQICASVIRPVVERMRPSNLDNPLSSLIHIVEGHRGGLYGFPSCHAANTIGAAIYLSLVFRRLRFTIFILAWALVTCWSRMYLGVHYPGDLFVGGVIGASGAFLFYFAARYVIIRYLHRRPDEFPDSVNNSLWLRLSGPFVPSDVPIVVGLFTVFWMVVSAAI